MTRKTEEWEEARIFERSMDIFEPSKEEEYVDLHGIKVGRWRCVECHRGVDSVGFCEIHGTMYIPGEQVPIDIREDLPAWDTALGIRLHGYLQEHKGATHCDVFEDVGIEPKAFCDHLDRSVYYDDVTYREEYRELYGLKEGLCPCEPK